MYQHIGQGCHRPDRRGRQQQSGMMHSAFPYRGVPPVVHVTRSRRRQAPEVVMPRSTRASQQLAVPQDNNQLRRRRRKRIESALRLQKSATDSPAKGRIIHTKAGEYGPAGGATAVL
jgi:hypothetical protein